MDNLEEHKNFFKINCVLNQFQTFIDFKRFLNANHIRIFIDLNHCLSKPENIRTNLTIEKRFNKHGLACYFDKVKGYIWIQTFSHLKHKDFIFMPVLNYLAGRTNISEEDLSVAAAFMQHFFSQKIKGVKPNINILKLLNIFAIYNLYDVSLDVLTEVLNGNYKSISLFINQPYALIECETTKGDLVLKLLYPTTEDVKILSEVFSLDLSIATANVRY